MSITPWLVRGLGVSLAVYAFAVLALVVAGRRSDARALAGLMVGYLAMPFDLGSDFIPVAGQLDDAILVAAVLRLALRCGGEERLAFRGHSAGRCSS